MGFVQLSERGTLDAMFGNAIGCVRTIIAAAATAQTAIATGSIATGGVSGNMDLTPNATAQILVVTPGSGATQNQYTNPAAFTLTAASATSLTIPSQSIGPARAVGDFIFLLNVTAATPATETPLPLLNTLYIGLTTQLTSGATQANIVSGEPTATGTYSRIVVPNNVANWAAATASLPASKTNVLALSFPASTAAYSTGATTLKAFFVADASTLAGGNVLLIGDLTTAQAVNASGITPSFAAASLTCTVN